MCLPGFIHNYHKEVDQAIIDQLVGFLESYKQFITPAADPLGLWSEEIYKIRQYGSFLPGKIDLARAKDTLIKEFTFSPD